MKENKMKKILVTWNGQPLHHIYPHATKWQVFKFRTKRFFRKVMIVTSVILGISGIAYVSFALGAIMTTPSVNTITQADVATPVLNRIAQCESSGSQTSKDGQVLLHWNKNGTVDIGKYAINDTVWGAQATKLGLDLTKPADNFKMALWIYENRGTTDWSDSQKCWEN